MKPKNQRNQQVIFNLIFNIQTTKRLVQVGNFCEVAAFCRLPAHMHQPFRLFDGTCLPDSASRPPRHALPWSASSLNAARPRAVCHLFPSAFLFHLLSIYSLLFAYVRKKEKSKKNVSIDRGRHVSEMLRQRVLSIHPRLLSTRRERAEDQTHPEFHRSVACHCVGGAFSD